jgi:B12-binding domain/radical SAM domain protein
VIKADLTLLHAPSVYDFREKSIFYGPMSDLVPSSPIFEMYPIGFLTLSNYLEKRGIRVRIINLAYLMMDDKDFDAERLISKIKTKAFGIDLHWLPHCQGSNEIAKIIKKYHPDVPVIFGGFSSSYFYKELIGFKHVDFVVRGDSAEEPLYRLMSAIKNNDDYLPFIRKIPNLVWKEKDEIHENPISCISKDLGEIDFDYRVMFKQVLRYKSLKSIIPFSDWLNYPVTTIPIIRGCNKNCSGCGGSKNAFELFGKRIKPAFRDPAKLVDEILITQRYIDAPVFILGDMTQGGKSYLEEFFINTKRLNKDIQIFFEFFEPPDEWFYDKIADNFNNFCFEISPDSHDENIRKKMGKNFSNNQLISSIKYALEKGAGRYDLYFMTGLPTQTKESIMQTVDFCEEFYETLGWDKRFMPFVSPMAPFIDPGSRAFENPDEFGYVITRKTLSEHIEAITRPSWKYILNYESKFLSRDDMVEATYDCAIGLNALKGRAGSISKKSMKENEERIMSAKRIMSEIDKIVEGDKDWIHSKDFENLKDKAMKYSLSTVCDKKELEFPLTKKNFKWFSIIKTVLFNR